MIAREEGLRLRQQYLGRAKRVVVKVGSAVLTTSEGLNYQVLDGLAHQIHALRQEGREVLVVSSGAVAAGRRKMALGNRPLTLREKQATAAVGQSSLMRAYEKIFEQLGHKVAQVLLTHDALSQRGRYLNVRNTLFTLLQWGLIPIINENDTVSVEELRFGDNDALGAMVTNLTEADVFFCLTDVAGLCPRDPGCDPTVEPLHTVTRLGREVEAMVGRRSGSAVGTGGMASKLRAAGMVAARGGCSLIGPGREPEVLTRIFQGELLGTFFLPREQKLAGRKHWIAYTLRPKGFLILDPGACQALREGGRSLLPSGIVEVRGAFGVGDPVHCLDQAGQAVAAGLVSYDVEAVRRIQGVKTSAIADILGYKDGDEVIHRDNLVIL